MLTLNEHLEISRVVQLFEGEQTEFTDEQFERAEYYDLKWNPVSGNTILSIYDESGLKLGEIEFEDADIAIEFVDEYFDLDEEDLRDLQSYSWADDGDNYDDRVKNAVADDGTSDSE